MKKIKLAFVGLGRVFNHYIGLILSDSSLCARFEISSLVDSNNTLFNEYLSTNPFLSVNCFTSFEDLIENDIPDIVVICTPSGTHYEISKFFLSRRIAVLCEKPATMKLSEADELLKLADANATKYWVAFQNRYNPPIVYAKKFIDSGMLGRFLTGSLVVRWSRDSQYYSSAEWRGTFKNDGGVINNQAIHHIDVLTYLLNPFSQILAIRNNSYHKYLEVEDTMVGAMRHGPSGNFLTFEMTTAIQNHDHEASISLFGENGYIQLGGIALNKLIDVHSYEFKLDNKHICYEYSHDVENGYGYGHRDLLLSLYDDFWGGAESISRAIHAFHTAQIINSSYNSDFTNLFSISSTKDNTFLGL